MLFSLLALLVLAWVILANLADSRLEETLAKLREDGYATDRSELAPPPVDESENGAPLYLDAFGMCPDVEEGHPMERVLDGEIDELAPEDLDQVRKLLEECTPLYRQLDEARSRTKCRFDREYSIDPFDEIPHIKKTLATTRLLAVRARVAASDGDHRLSREAVGQLLAILTALHHEPEFHGQLMRLSVVRVILETVDGCVTSQAPVVELQAWHQLMPPPGILDGMIERGLRWELAWAAKIAKAPFETYSGDIDEFDELGPVTRGVMSPFWKIGGARHVKRVRKLVDAVAKPYLDARPELTAIEESLEDAGALDIVSAILIPFMAELYHRQVDMQAKIVVIRTGLEFEIERAKTGAYPSGLVTLDPFNGKVLEYRREEGKILSEGPPDDDRGEGEDPFSTWVLRHPPQ